MFLLAFHIVSVGLLIMVVWTLAHKIGMREGERRVLRQMELDQEERERQEQVVRRQEAARRKEPGGQAVKSSSAVPS